jgi:hypothetical protein
MFQVSVRFRWTKGRRAQQRAVLAACRCGNIRSPNDGEWIRVGMPDPACYLTPLPISFFCIPGQWGSTEEQAARIHSPISRLLLMGSTPGTKRYDRFDVERRPLGHTNLAPEPRRWEQSSVPSQDFFFTGSPVARFQSAVAWIVANNPGEVSAPH